MLGWPHIGYAEEDAVAAADMAQGRAPTAALGTIARVVLSSCRLMPHEPRRAATSRADGDGDGKTGAAALNDGDAAAQAAAQQVKAARGVNIHA